MSDKQALYMKRRIEAVAGLLVLGLLLLAVRAVDLQWLQKDHLVNLAEKQRFRQYTVMAPRGAIYDRNGRILAESIEVPSIAAMADEVPKEDYRRLAAALHMSVSKLQHRLKNRKGFVWLARRVTPQQAEAVLALNVPGVRREKEWRRYHPLGPETGHLIGFVGLDGRGLEGLEHSYNNVLTGEAGVRLVRRDARGRSLPGGIWVREPRPGKDLHLTLDASIQSIAYAALAEAVRQQKARSGSVVVMDPRNGDVLAMVNWPGYNPNDFGRYRPGQWRNRSITDVFEPGSTLKPFTMAAALMSGRWHADSRVFCENGAMKVADYVIHDDHKEGWLDMAGLIAKSSNIGAAKLALDIGAEHLRQVLTDVGFGRRTQLGLSGESPGIIPPPGRWGPVETANIAFGQGIAVTPLQLATAFCVLANKGQASRPGILLQRERAQPQQVIPANIASQVVKMLEYATSAEGTGGKAVPAGYTVAGKTGTAQKPDAHGRYGKKKFMAVFAGMAPADDPRLVIAVVVDEPQKSIYGGQVAAPVFRKIAENVLPYLGVLPDMHQQGEWHMQEVRAGQPAIQANAGSLLGMTLREIRNVASRYGLQTRIHGSGWVYRQKPASIAQLKPGDSFEVWLNE